MTYVIKIDQMLKKSAKNALSKIFETKMFLIFVFHTIFFFIKV